MRWTSASTGQECTGEIEHTYYILNVFIFRYQFLRCMSLLESSLCRMALNTKTGQDRPLLPVQVDGSYKHPDGASAADIVDAELLTNVKESKIVELPASIRQIKVRICHSIGIGNGRCEYIQCGAEREVQQTTQVYGLAIHWSGRVRMRSPRGPRCGRLVEASALTSSQ